MEKDKKIITDRDECLRYIETAFAGNIDLDIISEELKNDSDVIVALIKSNQSLVNRFSEKLMSDPQLMYRVLNETDSTLYHRISPELKNNREFMLKAIEAEYEGAYYLGEELKKDSEFMKKCVEVLERNSERYSELGDKDLEHRNNAAKIYVQEKIKSLEKVEDKTISTENTESSISSEKEQLLANIKTYGSTVDIERISEELKNDPDVIVALIKSNQSLVNRFSEKLMSDPQLMYRVLNETDSTLYHRISPELKNNREFMLKAIEAEYEGVYYIGEELKKDSEFMKKCVEVLERNSERYSELGDKDLEHHNNVAKTYVQEKIKGLEKVEDKTISTENTESSISSEKEQLLANIKTYGGTVDIKRISEELKNDPDVIVALIKSNQSLVNKFSEKLMSDPQLMYRVLNETDSTLYHRISPELKNNREFMLKAIEAEYEGAYYLGEELKKDSEFMKKCVEVLERNSERYSELGDKDLEHRNNVAKNFVQEKIEDLKMIQDEATKKEESIPNNEKIVGIGTFEDAYNKTSAQDRKQVVSNIVQLSKEKDRATDENER